MKERLIDADIGNIAQCYSPNDMATIGITWFGFNQPTLDTISQGRQHDPEGFKRDVLIRWRNKNYPDTRQVCLESLGYLCDLNDLIFYLSFIP